MMHSRGMKVEVSAPTHLSLCCNLWLMYCRILKERERGRGQSEMRTEGKSRKDNWGSPINTNLSITRLPSLKRKPVHMSQNSASEGCVYGPKTSPILPVKKNTYILVHTIFKSFILDQTLLCLPPLEDHIVGETCQNQSQKTGVLEKLFGDKKQKNISGRTHHSWPCDLNFQFNLIRCFQICLCGAAQIKNKDDSPSAAAAGDVFLGIIL